MEDSCLNFDGLDIVVFIVILLKIFGVITISWWWIIGSILGILLICVIIGIIEP